MESIEVYMLLMMFILPAFAGGVSFIVGFIFGRYFRKK